MVESGHLNAIAFWFDLHLDDEVSITTAPSLIGLGGQALPSRGSQCDDDNGSCEANPLKTTGRTARQHMGLAGGVGKEAGSADSSFQPAQVCMKQHAVRQPDVWHAFPEG